MHIITSVSIFFAVPLLTGLFFQTSFPCKNFFFWGGGRELSPPTVISDGPPYYCNSVSLFNLYLCKCLKYMSVPKLLWPSPQRKQQHNPDDSNLVY